MGLAFKSEKIIAFRGFLEITKGLRGLRLQMMEFIRDNLLMRKEMVMENLNCLAANIILENGKMAIGMVKGFGQTNKGIAIMENGWKEDPKDKAI